MANAIATKDKKNYSKKEFRLLRSFLRQCLIFLISFGIVTGAVVYTARRVYDEFFSPVDAADSTEVKVEIPKGASVGRIADILYENGLIKNKFAFKIFVDISDKSTKLKAGKYKLSKNMTMRQIMDQLLTGGMRVPEVQVTIPEGKTVREIAQILADKLEFTEKDFLEAAKIENFIGEYSFLAEIPEKRWSGEYPLEGYLFPETYRFFADATPKDVIRKMLNQFEKVYKEEYMLRAQELGLTTDQVVTLASIVQGEARVKDEFPKIAAVFLNRLKKDMPLESCATIEYILEERKPVLSSEDLKIDSPYNTYKYKGLPEGPICCPGEIAIKAVLYPYEDYMDPKRPYLYFVLKDDNKTHAFNYSYQAHLRDKKKYDKLRKQNQ